MVNIHKNEPYILVLGDFVVFLLSLLLMLIIRYGGLPNALLFFRHFYPFFILFLVVTLIFYIAGLYDKHTVIIKNNLAKIIWNAQIAHIIVAVLFFYFIPYFLITPKTNLFIYLLFSILLMIGWRTYGYDNFISGAKQTGIIAGAGPDTNELFLEINNNPKYKLYLASKIDLDSIDIDEFKGKLNHFIKDKQISFIIIDLHNDKIAPIIPDIYQLLFSNIKIIELYKMYEDIFDRIPVSLIRHDWFLENLSTTPKITFDIFKRTMDIVLGLGLGILSLIIYPLVWAAIKIDDGGVFYSFQERVGKNNKLIRIVKFRTMTLANDKAMWGDQNYNEVTKIGSFLRKLRIDELPQLWNVFWGDISLIGPRPEFPGPVKVYESEIPYYSIRHFVKPGLSGWAQIYHSQHPHHGTFVEDTKDKLSYDLYYIKNRSVMLDIKIVLKTIRTLLSRSGI